MGKTRNQNVAESEADSSESHSDMYKHEQSRGEQ